MSMKDPAFEHIRQQVQKFARERDWEQFHTPKNLAMALSVEVAELMEHFQWLQTGQVDQLSAEQLAEITDEIADVQVYLIRLADKLAVDIPTAVAAKMVKNAEKYPADKVRGKSLKYTEYRSCDQDPE